MNVHRRFLVEENLTLHMFQNLNDFFLILLIVKNVSV